MNRDGRTLDGINAAQRTPSRAKIALVLGAGGPAGHAFHAGALLALQEKYGWAAGDAELIVGTSAGAQVAALLRGGMSVQDLTGRVLGQPLTPEGAFLAEHFVRPGYGRALKPGSPRRWMAAPRLALRLLSGRLGIALAGLLPEGHVDLSTQAERLRAYFGDEWPMRRLWINAVCLGTGDRVTFGQAGAPLVDVGTAVACSGAIPSICRPLRVGDRRFVDGGFASFTNMDLVKDEDFDLIIISSPLSRYAPIRWRTRRQAQRLRRPGVQVLLLEPQTGSRRAMGWNMMDLTRAPAVCSATTLEVSHQLDGAAWPLGPLKNFTD